MPKQLKKISEEVVHENPWFLYKHDKYELPEGGEGDYYYAETNGAAIVVPVREDGRIVLVVQSRYLAEKQSIEFPAGSVLHGMEIVDTARAELREETGWEADEMQKIGVFAESNCYIKGMQHVFLTNVTEQHQQDPEPGEDIEVIYRRPDEIVDMIERGDIWCGNTLAAWALAQNYFLSRGSSEAAPKFNALFKFFLGEE